MWAWATYVRLRVWRWWLIRHGADPAALLRPDRPPMLPFVRRCTLCARWSPLVGPDGWCLRCERTARDIAADHDPARRWR